jgi:hypothetical protein
MKEKNYTFPKNNIFEFFITNSISPNQNIPTDSDQDSSSNEEDGSNEEDEEDEGNDEKDEEDDEGEGNDEESDEGNDEESDEGNESEESDEGNEGEESDEEETLISIPNPSISIDVQDKVNSISDLKEKTNNKQIYDYTIKEFYYNFINSTLEITKSIKETMSNSSDMKTKSSLIDVLSNKKNLINVGIMLILISILLIPVILS